MISILIAEDQTMVLGALAALLDLEDDFEIIGQANNGKIAFEKALKDNPDIIITDIEMPIMTGIELAQELKKVQHTSNVMILTTFARSGYLRRAMDAGVKGYLLKDAPSKTLADAVRKIAEGKVIVEPTLVTDAWSEIDPLNNKERKVLKLAYEGKSTDEIASIVSLTSGTVRNYLSEAASKLNAKNRVEAARIAWLKGWL